MQFYFFPLHPFIKSKKEQKTENQKERVAKNCVYFINQVRGVSLIWFVSISITENNGNCLYFWKVLKVIRILNGKLGVPPLIFYIKL